MEHSAICRRPTTVAPTASPTRANDGTADSTVATVSLTVDPANHAPLAANDSYGVNLGQILNVAANGVLANDADADNDPLTAVLVTGPMHGSLTFNMDGSFDYTPNVDLVGSSTDSFTYRANDGNFGGASATVIINIFEGADTLTFSTSSANAVVVLKDTSGIAIHQGNPVPQSLGVIRNVLTGVGNDTITGTTSAIYLTVVMETTPSAGGSETISCWVAQAMID